MEKKDRFCIVFKDGTHLPGFSFEEEAEKYKKTNDLEGDVRKLYPEKELSKHP